MKLICFILAILLLKGCSNTSSFKESEADYEKIADNITAKVVQQIQAETGLIFAGIGGGMMNQINMMAISFNYCGELSLERSRELLIYCVNKYLNAINEDMKIRPYLVCYPFTSKEIEIRIFISKKNREDVPRGSLSVISEVKGILEYDIRGPSTDRLHTIHKETFEEAVKILETEGRVNEPIRKLRF